MKWYRRCAFCALSYRQHDDVCVWTKTMRAARRSPNGIVVALTPAFLASVIALVLVACATPAILITAPTPCGQYPVDCGTAADGNDYCCPENNLCRISPDGNRYCEFNPAEAKRQRALSADAGD